MFCRVAFQAASLAFSSFSTFAFSSGVGVLPSLTFALYALTALTNAACAVSYAVRSATVPVKNLPSAFLTTNSAPGSLSPSTFVLTNFAP
ncbi:hypothetical protein [Anaerococcus vaginalis]|uniref:hypothetical protein n=1 Tax=Anaerococcus vaginalis TaxID=33037 RepID=UPI0018995792